jgi:hypothetical protein
VTILACRVTILACRVTILACPVTILACRRKLIHCPCGAPTEGFTSRFDPDGFERDDLSVSRDDFSVKIFFISKIANKYLT